MRPKDHGANGPYQKIAIQTTMDRLKHEVDQREGKHRAKNHLMNIYGGRFWFSLNVTATRHWASVSEPNVPKRREKIKYQ